MREGIIYTESAFHAVSQYFRYDTLCVTRIAEGFGKWHIGNESCDVGKGDFVFLSNVEPRYLTEDSGNLRIETVSFQSELLASVGTQEYLRVFYGRTSDFTHVLHDDSVLLPIWRKLKDEFFGQHSRGLLTAYLTELLILSGRQYDAMNPPQLEKNFRCDVTAAGAIADSTVYIGEHLTSELSVDKLAKLAGFSSGHYSRLFKKYVSMTPAAYIAYCRVRRFHVLSQTREGTIFDTALLCGFTSSSGFYKAMKKFSGKTAVETSDRTAVEPADRAAVETPDRTAVEMSDRTAVETSDGTAVETSDGTAVETSDRAAVETSDRAAVETADEAAVETSDRTAVETSDGAAKPQA